MNGTVSDLYGTILEVFSSASEGFEGAGVEALPAIFSAFLNALPIVAVCLIADLIITACWSWKLLKSALALSGAIVGGYAGNILSVYIWSTTGYEFLAGFVSVSGVVTLVCAGLGALLFLLLNRLVVALIAAGAGYAVGAVAASATPEADIMSKLIAPDTTALVVGICAAVVLFVAVLLLYKYAYVFVTCILSTAAAGVIAALTVVHSLENAMIAIYAAIAGAVIGLILGFVIASRQLRDY